MPGTQKVLRLDVLQSLRDNVVNFFRTRRRETFFSSPSDGIFLKLHYKHTFWMFMATFAMVYYNWMANDIIRCVSHYNAEVQVRPDHLNLCLSYPFLVEGGRRITLLFYRWLHWVILFCALAFILPHKLAKLPRYDKVNKLIDFMSQGVLDYINEEKAMVEKTCKHFAAEVGGHNYIYFKYLGANVLSLTINVAVFFALDAVLLGNFRSLGVEAFPLTVSRDGQYLSDPLTKAFPPFVDCELKDVHVLTNKRNEHFGCHLLAQEFYEKIFLGLWYWLVFLMVVQTGYVIFIVGFYLKGVREAIFKVILRSLDNKHLSSATRKFQIGDWFLLYKLRQCFYYNGFSILVEKLADRDEMRNFEVPRLEKICKVRARSSNSIV